MGIQYNNQEINVITVEEQRRKDNLRKKARRKAIKDGRVSLGDETKDVDHKKPLSKGGTNAKGNTKVMSSTTNRSKGGAAGGKMVTGKAKRDAGSKGGKVSSRKGVPNKNY
jgi:hypothetical protein